MRVLKIALIVRKGQKKLLNFLLKDMFLVAGGIQFGPPCVEWNTEKTKKWSLDVRKMSKKVKLPSKLFFQLPIWRQNSSFINKAANFLPQIRQFLAQSRKLFHKINIMFWSKCLTGHVKLNFDNFVDNFLTKLEKSSLKLDTKLKKNSFLKKNWSKISRTFRMQIWQNWRNFSFKAKIFFARTRS